MPDAPANEERARDVFAEAEKEGIDLSLLRENLRLTPTERLDQHQRSLRSMLDVRAAGIAHRKRLNGQS